MGTLDLDFLRRVRKTSLITAAVIGLTIGGYVGLAPGAAWLLGCIWSVINLFLIGLLVKALLTPGRTRRLQAALVALLKVPVLYVLGFLMLSSGRLPLPFLLAGFLWPLAVVFLKMLGRILLRMDGRGADEAHIRWWPRENRSR